MTDKIIARIVRESGIANLLEVLGQQLAPTDLQSLLIAVFRQRAGQQTPRRVLEQYERNPFVRPSPAPVRALLDLDRIALDLATPLYAALDLAPLAPLGTCSALAPLDQNRVVTTIRNTEVVSDATNVLALECAVRRQAQRQAKPPSPGPVRLCASHRLTRAQQYSGPHLYAHFRMFNLCTAGRSSAPGAFEGATTVEQVAFYLRFLQAAADQGYRLAGLRVAFIPLADDAARQQLEQAVIEPLAAQFPAAQLALDPNPTTVAGYYEWVRFQIYARDPQGDEHMIGDGGFTDWTRQLLSDTRERLLTSGIATERVATLFPPEEVRR
jgi:hypothetical protein